MISIIFIINTLALPNRHSHFHGHHFEALRFLNSPLLKSIQWKHSGSSSPLSNFFPTRTFYIHKNACPSFQSLPKNLNKNTPMHTKKKKPYITSLLELYRLPPKGQTKTCFSVGKRSSTVDFSPKQHYWIDPLFQVVEVTLGLNGPIGPVEVVWIVPGNGGIC